jgi:galactokinase
MTTLVGVARLVNVTATTVSNVLRQSGQVNEETKRRVLAAAERLSHRPNLMARALLEGRLMAESHASTRDDFEITPPRWTTWPSCCTRPPTAKVVRA